MTPPRTPATAANPHNIRKATECHCVPGHHCDCIEARVHAAELTTLVSLQWKADQRAIKRWQEGHPGNDLTWPDRADMVVWLMGQHAPYRKALAALVAALDKADHFIGKLEDGTFDHRSLAVVDALAAARRLVES